MGTRRQFSETNCPIFCIRDAIHYSKNPSLFSFCRDATHGCPEKSANENIQYFATLPPAMLKMTQSITQLREKAPTIYNTLKDKGNVRVDSSTKEQNVYIEKKFLKYERILIAMVIAKTLENKP